MAYLQELKVKKVSFVRRGANKKQFFLAKSADFTEEGVVKENNNNNNNHSGGARKMRPEVKTKLSEILKAERNIDKVVGLLKEDAVLKATDEELVEVRDIVELLPPPVEAKKQEENNDAAALVKAQAEAKKAEEEKKALEARLAKIDEDTHLKDDTAFIEKECPYLNVATEDAVAQIVKAEKVDAATAEMLKQSFISTSDAIRVSQLTKELGRSGEDGLDPIGGNVVAEIVKKTQDLRKADSKAPSSELIRAAIHDLGATRYENYRKEFNRRARTY